MHARDTRARARQVKNAITAHLQTNIQQWVLHIYYPTANSTAMRIFCANRFRKRTAITKS